MNDYVALLLYSHFNLLDIMIALYYINILNLEIWYHIILVHSREEKKRREVTGKFSKEKTEENICNIIILCVIKLRMQCEIALIKPMLWEVNIIWTCCPYFPQ